MTTTPALWTLQELTLRVVTALAAEHGAAPNGRVREVPDARTIRWYQTTGLVDRPEIRGRTAYYSRRHLLQLLAIKRLQSKGLPLSEIQAKLAGMNDAALTRLTQLPEDPAPSPEAPAKRFWTTTPAPPQKTKARRRSARRVTIDAIHLTDNVTLLIDTANWHLNPTEEATVVEAATPLLDVLRRLGVITPDPTDNEIESNTASRPKEPA